MHWFTVESKDKFSKRQDIKLVLEKSEVLPAQKTESRPHLIDWNRDGFVDVVVAMHLNETDYADLKIETEYGFKEPEYRYTHKLLVNYGSAERKKQISNDQNAKSRQPKDNSWGSPTTGPDLELNLREIDFDVAEGDVEFVFDDFDGDGNFDLLYFQNFSKREFNKEESRWIVSDEKHGIFWQRNLTDKGEPKFAAPVKLLDSPKPISSFATVDFDRDGLLDVAVSSAEVVRLYFGKR